MRNKARTSKPSITMQWIMIFVVGVGILLLGILNYIWIKNIKENPRTDSSGVLNREYDQYSWPDTLLTENDVIMQYFSPVDEGLSEIHIRLAYNHTTLLQENRADIRLVLRNVEGNVIVEKDVPCESINNWHYYVLETDGLKKGEVYSISLMQTCGAMDESGEYILSWVPFSYENDMTEDIPLENLQCEYNGIVQDYAWDLYYVYHKVNGGKVRQLICVDVIAISGLILWMFLAWHYKKAAVILLVMILTGSVGYYGVATYRENNMWFNKNTYIAHAMGGIRNENISYSNCLEAFEENYNNGFRIFEVDFSITSDNQIALIHDWENALGRAEEETGYIPTLEEYKKTKLYGQYTTMDINDLFGLMIEYPDIYIVTDSKYADHDNVKRQFIMISDRLDDYSLEERKHIISHLIIQLYNDEMLETVESIIHFKYYIYTVYQRGGDNLDQLADFCIENDIPVVTMPYTWWTEESNELLHKKGLKVFLHTLNDAETAQTYLKAGVDGIYTDFIIPSD